MNRKGIALLVALVVLTALGMIAATAFSLARLERRAGTGAVAEVQAQGAAEAALAEATRGWPRALVPVMPGQETALLTLRLPGPADGSVVLRSLGGPVFLLRASGMRYAGAGFPAADVRIELLVRLDSAGPDSLIRPKREPRGWVRQSP
jgi:type II secretory pathway pseudopilin PulG